MKKEIKKHIPAFLKRNLVPYSADSYNILIDLRGDIGSSLMGKEE